MGISKEKKRNAAISIEKNIILEKVRVGPRFLPLHFYSAHQLQMFLSYKVKIKNPFNQNHHKFYSN